MRNEINSRQLGSSNRNNQTDNSDDEEEGTEELDLKFDTYDTGKEPDSLL